MSGVVDRPRGERPGMEGAGRRRPEIRGRGGRVREPRHQESEWGGGSGTSTAAAADGRHVGEGAADRWASSRHQGHPAGERRLTVRQAVRLGHILTRSDSWIVLEPGEEYKEVTIRLWGRGVVRRRVTNNSVVAGARRLRVRAGQFILSRIDARNGAFGLVPRELDGAVVSNDFPAFGVDQDRVEPAYLGWLSKTRDFMQRCRAASEGTTNRVRLNEARFLELEISIPPLPEQRRIVARLDELARKTEEIRSIRASLQSERRQLLLSVFHRLTMKAPSQRLGEVAPVTRRPVRVREDAEYPELGIRSF